jgi:uncharacterized membrane-anchored protein
MPIADTAQTFFAIMLMVVLVAGYVAIWAIWHFFFRGKGKDDERRPPDVGEPR